MQRSELMRAVALAAALVFPASQSVIAQSVAPDESASARALAARAAQITIGAQESATVRELNEMHRKARLAEARKRALDSDSQLANLGAVPPVLPPIAPAPVPVSGNSGNQARAGASAQGEGAPAKLLGVLIIQGRARADVITDDATVTTVREGDKIADWMVTAIRPDRVEVQRHVAGRVQTRTLEPAEVVVAQNEGATAGARVPEIPPVPSARRVGDSASVPPRALLPPR